MHPLKIRTRFNLLRETWQFARDEMPRLELPPAIDAKTTAIQLHATIVEMVGACILLFERGYYSPIPVLLRVVYEAFVEQKALEREASYLKHIAAASLWEGRNMPDLINRQQKGLLHRFLAEPGAREFLGHIKDAALEIADGGGERMEPEAKFKAAGLENEYPLYRTLSGAVHNDFGALQTRHALPVAEDGSRELGLFRIPGEMDLVNMLDSALCNLLRSCSSIHRGNAEFRALMDSFGEQLRQEADGEERRLSKLDKYQGTRK